MTKKLARGVALVGAGMSKFGAFPDKTSRDLFVEAYQEMKNSVEKGIDPNQIEAFYMGNFSSDQFEKQAHLAPIVASWVGLKGIPTLRVEDACASGGVALREAVLGIASGLYDVVLVGGLEKMTDLPIAEVTEALATAADTQFEIPAGFTFPGFYAAMATAYLDQYDASPVAFQQVSIKNHMNGALNDKAQFGQTITEIMESKKARAIQKGRPEPAWKTDFDFLSDPAGNPNIAWPMTLFDCSPVSDGAAAALLVAEDIADQFTDHPIYIIGTGQASDGALAERETLCNIPAAKEAAQQAYAMAGLTPKDIDFAEVHDCFTIAEIMATEDLGFFPEGEGWKAAMAGKTARNGEMPVNTSGGLKAKGHPVGASGIGQVNEIWKQLNGIAGERQLQNDPKIALAHNVGGSGQTCVVHIFERRN
ncbi:MAG: beta-ketoacyl synthase N-terminal-like domain-containing protein [Anaerolineae bacterium]|jgi:acetyl-CoA acetyltransferase|nr:beta-ketoacyl synthase N-terminal-like domain-containing protein [Anaerolineae bacterium]